jgi:hypothetical protein
MSFLSAVLLTALLAPSSAPLEMSFDGDVGPGLVLVGDWVDVEKIDGRRISARTRAVYEATTGLTHHFVFGPNERLIRHTVRVKGNRPTSQEIARAFRMALNDPAARAEHLSGAEINGGFLLEQEEAGAPCAMGSRCIQVFLFEFDPEVVVRHMVVDLAAERIAYPRYIPTQNR